MAYIRDQLIEEECTKCEGHEVLYIKDDEIECQELCLRVHKNDGIKLLE